MAMARPLGSKKIKPNGFLFGIFVSFLLFEFAASSSSSPSLSQASRCLTPYNKTTNNESTFEWNLATLLNNLTYMSSSLGFYSSSSGRPPNQAYGLYLCRGDTALRLCHECVNSAQISLSEICPSSKASITYKDTCMLRYANYSISSQLNTREAEGSLEYGFWFKSANPEKYNRTLEGLIEALIEKVASNRTTSFATMEASLDSGDGTLYGLAQCTPDLGRSNCSACLKKAFSQARRAPSSSMDATSFLPSCQLRYDNTSFYDVGSVASAATVARSFFRSSFEARTVQGLSTILWWFVVIIYLAYCNYI